MPDLPNTPTVEAIYKHYENRPDERRTYLGVSRIGLECRRQLWLEWRWAGRATFPGRILRLFETGHREEDRIIENLRAIGCRVEGQQHEVIAEEGFVRGHLDGAILGLLEAPKTWHVFDVKTMNKRNFDKWMKEGTERAKPVYYAQLQVGGYLAELKKWALIVQCKDDDRIHIERGEVKKTFAKEQLRKARLVIHADTPPDRIARDPSYWECKFCDMRGVCWKQQFPDVNCRTCAHWTPDKCGRGLEMDPDCQEHIYLPSLLHWLTPINGSETHVEYAEFVNAAATGFAGTTKTSITSRELHATTVPV